MTSVVSNFRNNPAVRRYPQLVLVSTSEFALKSRPVRRQLQSQLTEHMRLLLRRNGIGTIRTRIQGGRIILEPDREAGKAADVCSKVFGVAWAASAFMVPTDKQIISELCLQEAGQRLGIEETFAVRAHHSQDAAIRSRDLERHVGQLVLDEYSKLGIRVDLDNPTVTIHIELGSEDSLVYFARISGPAGLPVGSQGKMLGLIERLDLANIVAFHQMMRRGASVFPVSFADRQSTIGHLIRLRMLIPKEKYYFWHVGGLEDVAERASKFAHVIAARLVMRVLNLIARREKAVGVVDSQIPRDAGEYAVMRALSALGLVPVHRPLVGLTDSEVRQYANYYGLESEGSLHKIPSGFEGVKPFDLCEVERIEQSLGVEAIAEGMFSNAEKVLVPVGDGDFFDSI